jgi:hypothetical protein
MLKQNNKNMLKQNNKKKTTTNAKAQKQIITQSLKSVGKKRNYSTNNTYSKLNNISLEEFAHWF